LLPTLLFKQRFLRFIIFSYVAMGRLLLVLLLGSLVGQPFHAAAQQPAKASYMQIFYEGASWLAGREVLHYSPAFRGKTGELVPEDSTKVVSPGALVFGGPSMVTTTSTLTSVTTEKGTFVPGAGGKMRPQTAADISKQQATEAARLNRSLNLVEARANLARTTLTQALNNAAADGWEVVQMTTWGTQGGLVYLLRRR
jgi:hypothetical protein